MSCFCARPFSAFDSSEFTTISRDRTPTFGCTARTRCRPSRQSVSLPGASSGIHCPGVNRTCATGLQSVKPREQFIGEEESAMARGILKGDTGREDNNNHYSGGLRGGRPTSTNSLASATRIINHHLFGSIVGARHHAGKYLTTIESDSTAASFSLSSERERARFIPLAHRVSRGRQIADAAHAGVITLLARFFAGCV